jgi:hypothetical protein
MSRTYDYRILNTPIKIKEQIIIKKETFLDKFKKLFENIRG